MSDVGVYDLSGLDGLRQVESLSLGGLWIQNLDGLSGLEQVRWLYFSGMGQLSNYDAIANVTFEQVGFDGCVYPTSLPRLRYDEAWVDVFSSEFTVLAGLGGTKSLRHLELRENWQLSSLAGLEDLRTVQELRVETCPLVASLG